MGATPTAMTDPMRPPRESEESALQSADEIADRRQMIDMIGYQLDTMATEQVSMRSEIEERWIKDLRQWNGVYEPKLQQRLKDNKESEIFVNITRNKANAAEARLMDLLFPSDDKNWAINPTPVPELMKQVRNTEPLQTTDGQQLPQMVDEETGQPREPTHADLAMRRMEQAKETCRLMEREIDDHLKEARYNATSRDAIAWGVRLGTGIIKGPTSIKRMRRKWEQVKDDVYKINGTEERRATVSAVNPWNFFPDMAAAHVDEAEFVFELHPMTKRQVRKLKQFPGFHEDQLRRLLQQEPTDAINVTRVTELRNLSDVNSVSWDNRYHVWEYNGPIERRWLDVLDLADDILGEEDPLKQNDGTIWFCQGIVLKAVLSPMETGEPIYSIFNWERSESSIFGFGVPYLMRNPQKVINASWRMILDNAGLSTGPQIIINRDLVEPLDGQWKLSPRKIWVAKREDTDVEKAFMAIHIDSRQEQLVAIFQVAKQLADEETSIPLIAQGEMGQHVTQTKGGMSMLMNASNIVIRRAVKNWDDDITVPTINRFYDWLMQFSSRGEIKGDMEVIAQGSSALLDRELQVQNLMHLLKIIGLIPMFMKYTKGPQFYRKIVRLLQFDADDVIKSDAEIGHDEQQERQRGAPADPEVLKLQAQKELKQMEMEGQAERNKIEVYTANSKAEIEIAKLAAQENMKVSELEAQLGLEITKMDHEKDLMNMEEAIARWKGSGI